MYKRWVVIFYSFNILIFEFIALSLCDQIMIKIASHFD